MIAVGNTLLSSYENIPFGFTPPVFGIKIYLLTL